MVDRDLPVLEQGVASPPVRRTSLQLTPLAFRPDRDARLQRERIEIRELLSRKAQEALRERLGHMHPADIAEHLEDMELDRIKLVLSLVSNDKAADVLRSAEEEQFQLELAQALGRDRLADILDALPSDEVVDILAQFDQDELERVLDDMDAEDAAEVMELLQFDEESAGGLMAVELIDFHPEMTSAEVIEKIRRHRDELETVNYLYITDEDQVLLGVVSLRELIMADPDQRVGEYLHTDVIRVHVSDDQEDVAQTVAKYDLLAVPVVDDNGVLKGIVTVDDILDVLEEEATEDIFGMAGLDPEEAEEESALKSAFRRLPWLLFTLLGAFLSGSVLGWYSSTLDEVVALAVFIPAIMGLGGNIAVQSSTLVVRGFATGDLEEREVGGLIRKEIFVGLILGVVLGSASGAVGWMMVENAWIGAVVAVSMTAQFTVSATNGVLMPYLLRRLRCDPALASGPFVTMVSDLTGLLIYFTLASRLLDRLL